MMSHADIALYGRDGQLMAVVEIKKTLGTSREWAARLRRNMLAHDGFHGVGFFLLATPEHLYLWRPGGGESDPIQPTYEIDGARILQPYFERAGIDPSMISGPAFELVVGAWLSDLVRPDGMSEQLVAEQSWLTESGFLRAVRNGRVEYEIAA